MSRVPIAAAAHVHSAISLNDESFLLDVVRRSQEAATEDTWFAEIASRCTPTSTEFAMRNNVVCKLVEDLYAPVIPPTDQDLKRLILLEIHASGLGGHLGFDKMWRECKRRFYWKHMRKDVQRFVKECAKCQESRSSTLPPQGFLQPHAIPV